MLSCWEFFLLEEPWQLNASFCRSHFLRQLIYFGNACFFQVRDALPKGVFAVPKESPLFLLHVPRPVAPVLSLPSNCLYSSAQASNVAGGFR